MHARQRPNQARFTGDGMKLHRRTLRLHGRTVTAVSPRPGTDCRFSTNRFHDTWHVVTDVHGARLLGRLLWGLSYQRSPGTFVLLGPEFLEPNPFDGARSDPIVLAPQALTPLTAQHLRDLRRLLPLRTPPDGTVRWHTPGLGPAVAAETADREAWRTGRREPAPYPWWSRRSGDSAVRHIGGLLLVTALPGVLRRHALDVWPLGARTWDGMDYTYLDDGDGEVQVFTDYRRRVGAARTARAEVLAALPEPPAPADLAPLVWPRTTVVRRRRSARPVRSHRTADVDADG